MPPSVITIKSPLNYRTIKLKTEDELNRTHISEGIKEEATLRRAGGARHNGLTPNPKTAVVRQEGHLSGGSPLLKSEGSHSHPGLPSPWDLYRDEEIPQQLAVKNQWCPFKGPCTPTPLQALTLGSSGRAGTQEAPDTYKERLRWVASRQGLQKQRPLIPCGASSPAAYRRAPSFPC